MWGHRVGLRSGQVFHNIVRSLHFKENHKKYPKVNVDDVVLDKPRYGFRKERPSLLSQSVTDEIFSGEAIRKKYMKEGKPVPIKYRSHSDRIARRNFEKYQEEIANGQAHFRVGEKEIYLPKARVCLLRPNAKHTPYQAKFLVPRNFNKMDLRDYLWNIYGLRALNVTVQLLHAKFERGPNDVARYRGPQYKKMTIEMEEPFIWPDLPQDLLKENQATFEGQLSAIEHKNNTGSDKHKPSEAFDGLYNKPILPSKFVSANFKREAGLKMKTFTEQANAKHEKELVKNFLNL